MRPDPHEVIAFWQAVIDRVEFRNVKLEVDWLLHYDCAVLTLRAEVEDTYHPGVTIPVIPQHRLPPGELLEKTAIEVVRHSVRTWWLHEFDELFRVDGQIYDNPHERNR